MGRQRPKGHKPNKDKRRAWRTKRRTKDLDQIYDELQGPPIALPVDHDLPGKGQFLCVSCSRYFINEETLKSHFKTKVHKKRLKNLQTKPYEGPQEDGQEKVDNGPKLRLGQE